MVRPFIVREADSNSASVLLLRPDHVGRTFADDDLLGYVEAKPMDTHTLPGCRDALLDLRQLLDFDFPVLVVTQSSLIDSLKNAGWGAWMYAEVARLAWKHARAGIAAHACDRGSTQREARRVWKSRRFLEWVDCEDLVAVWRFRELGDADQPVPLPRSR